jgi:recombination protein RecT
MKRIMATNEKQAVNQSNALAVKHETVDLVTARIREFQNRGELYFPSKYVPENALKSAWLILQEAVDKDYKPVLTSCTKESIANALFSMTVQALNPDKRQCYFIAYGNKLTMQRSYFGSMAVAKSVNPDIEDIFADVVYADDDFEYAKVRGKTVISKHVQKLANIKKASIVAAYATVLYRSGREESMIMTLDEIKQSWKQSKMNPVLESGELKAGSTHDKFMAEMCRKTVINRLCKTIINSSDDSNLAVRYAKEAATETQEAEAAAEISEKANKIYVDIDTGEVIDVDAKTVEAEQQSEPEPDREPEVKKEAPAAKTTKQPAPKGGQLPLEGKDDPY